jgi:hypothetical protein
MICRSDDLLHNGSGYIDPTAYEAMKNYDKEQREMKFRRGYIYEYEVKPGDIRPALVVSADFRAGDDILNVIVLSKDRKTERDVIVGGRYYADPACVSFAWASRIGECIVGATAIEMWNIGQEIMRYLGLEREECVVEVASDPTAVTRDFSAELIEAKTEARIYRELYERLQGILAGCGKA